MTLAVLLVEAAAKQIKMPRSISNLYTEIKSTINCLDTNSITLERKKALQSLAKIIQQKHLQQQAIRLQFICTHNSRRSHLSQVWAQTLAHHFNIQNIQCYSGGTEVTALFPIIINTLKSAGFQIEAISKNKNPIYSIKYADNELPIIGFSKKIDDEFNPKSKFIAIMTCDSANEACPIVIGAEDRIPITYNDPKIFDNSTLQAEKYKATSMQIATELFYTFSLINS